MLDEKEKEYYQRQILGFGENSQEKLKQSCVAVVGAGGLGSPVLEYLARAGVGRIVIIDNGKVDRSNLNRQFYTEADIGKPKATISKERAEIINPHIRIEYSEKRVTGSNAEELLKDADVVVDALDNLESRMVLSKTCKKMGKPLVHGTVEGFRGYQMTCLPEGKYLEHLGNKESDVGLFPILGATAGVIGALEALETVKLLIGKGKPNTGLLVFNGKDNILERVKL